jgi:hypothetical protein
MLRRLRHNEHPPTGESQVCKKCHDPLPARWFHFEPRNLSGREGSCLACRAAAKHALSRRKPQPPKQKLCRKCQRTLDAACFSRKRVSADGLCGRCRECRNADAKSRKQPLFTVAVPEKRCCDCKMAKPAAEFYINRHSVDGLTTECQECTKLRVQQQRQLQQQQEQ